MYTSGDYFVECIGTGYLSCPVQFKSKNDAIEWANQKRKSCMEVRVYDCSNGPVGILIHKC